VRDPSNYIERAGSGSYSLQKGTRDVFIALINYTTFCFRIQSENSEKYTCFVSLS
jgi:hypothetical protein